MWVRIVALAGCYYGAGQIGLLLAIPPGYATAFWPAAGIALAGLLLFGKRVWPGVLIGSFLINVTTTFKTDNTAALILSLALPAGIGAGAALQALVGAALVRRFVGYPNPLNREQDVATLLMVAGPLSCLINATIGVALLWSMGRIQPEKIAFSWWTWWVGDTIGAFVVTPLVLLWSAQPQPDWPRRPITVTLPLGILAGLVVILFVLTDAREQEHMQAWIVLAGGMMFTGLLGAVLLVVTGREALISGLVQDRTAELAQANAAMIQEINERLRAEEALRSSEERFRALTQSINDAVISADTGGAIVFWNKSAQTIFGYSEEEAVGQPLTLLMPESYQEAYRKGIEHFRSTGASRLIGKVVALQGRRKDGSEFPLELSLAVWETQEGKFFGGVLRDITLRKQAEDALEESRRFVERIAEMMPGILYVYDLKEQRNLFINQRIESILGYAQEDTHHPGTPFLLDNFHPDDLPKVEWANEQYQTAEDGAVIETEYRMRHANGQWRWLHSRNTIFIRDHEGNPCQILGTAQDITDRKRLEQEVLEIAASEQRRIGQELHDGTGQELTGLCMLADNLADALRESSPNEAQLARRIAHGLRRALGQVRALSRGLIPVEVDAEGLMAALTELTTRISDLHGVHCVFECLEPVPVEDNHTATQLFRIAQEAITNALKHAQAANTRVSLETKGTYITLKIVDDGVGLPDTEEEREGMGLRIMRYRAGQIGAHFSAHPGPARGTVVTCTLFRGVVHE